MLTTALLVSVLSVSTAPAISETSPAPAPASGQAAAPYRAITTDLYAPPTIRPYEPPSNFGRQAAEGDADAAVRAAPLSVPVTVEAYDGAYEPRRSAREVSYLAGVETARRAQNERMGGLDGQWRVVDAEGRPLMELVLTDRGPAWPVEGALALIHAEPAASPDRIGLISAVPDEGGERIIAAEVEGRRLTLHLHRDGQAWRGRLSGLARGSGQPIALVRPETW